MKVVLNGREHEVAAGTTVETLARDLGLDARNIAVELNQVIVKKAGYAETVLREGDRLEVVHFVGGG